MADTARARYSGSSRKLVVALDIGTTFSGAAYALLDPGEIPEIQSVTRYPNSLNTGSAKVSSILYYDQNGNFRGVENGADLQDDEEFLRIRWWKLMMSPTEPSTAMRDQMSEQLPRGKSLIDVFADFIRYLFDSTKALFKTSEPNGELRWNSVSENIELVLTHPNGWGGLQQAKLRTAAVRAGVVCDTPDGRSRVRFVTEGEASFNFCATHTEAGKHLRSGEDALIIDAGGGTIDISAYTVLNGNPLQVEELYEPKCLLQGAEFVTARAREMVQGQLRDSRFDTPEDLAAFSQRFDEGLKRVFSGDQAPQYVKFGSPRDNDPERGIKAGRLMLTGMDVCGFFEPSIRSIVVSIKHNFSQRLTPGSIAFLVGGFTASAWLAKELEERLSVLGLKICKPDTHTNKAVAVGAVSFYVDHFATGRISKFTYGAPFHSEGESPMSQVRCGQTPEPSERPEKETEETGRDAVQVEEMKRLERRVRELEGTIERERANAEKQMEREKTSAEKRMDGLVEQSQRKDRRISELVGQSQDKDEQIKELERKIGEMRDFATSLVKRLRETEERLKRTEELLAARSAELMGTQSFLSTKDRLSEAEVLDIVRDLNQNIYQVADKLTEEWKKLEPRDTSQRDANSNSRAPVPALVRLVRNQDSGSLTFLLQSRLCYQAACVTSSWRRQRELATIESVYERLYASEGQAISARWRSLTQTYLSRQPPNPETFVEELAKEFHNTRSFSSHGNSTKFVRDVALDGIQTTVRLALRLESVFKVDITSSDMFLLFETRGTPFDDAKMTNEYGSDGVASPEKQDERGRRYRIAGTTEVGVGKSICEGPGKSRRTVIMLKANVVLNTDVAGSGK